MFGEELAHCQPECGRSVAEEQFEQAEKDNEEWLCDDCKSAYSSEGGFPTEWTVDCKENVAPERHLREFGEIRGGDTDLTSGSPPFRQRNEAMASHDNRIQVQMEVKSSTKRQKNGHWTELQVDALMMGLRKYEDEKQKWKCIQNDPEFSHALHCRSNIDLKDKWENCIEKLRKLALKLSELPQDVHPRIAFFAGSPRSPDVIARTAGDAADAAATIPAAPLWRLEMGANALLKRISRYDAVGHIGDMTQLDWTYIEYLRKAVQNWEGWDRQQEIDRYRVPDEGLSARKIGQRRRQEKERAQRIQKEGGVSAREIDRSKRAKAQMLSVAPSCAQGPAPHTGSNTSARFEKARYGSDTDQNGTDKSRDRFSTQCEAREAQDTSADYSYNQRIGKLGHLVPIDPKCVSGIVQESARGDVPGVVPGGPLGMIPFVASAAVAWLYWTVCVLVRVCKAVLIFVWNYGWRVAAGSASGSHAKVGERKAGAKASFTSEIAHAHLYENVDLSRHELSAQLQTNTVPDHGAVPDSSFEVVGGWDGEGDDASNLHMHGDDDGAVSEACGSGEGMYCGDIPDLVKAATYGMKTRSVREWLKREWLKNNPKIVQQDEKLAKIVAQLDKYDIDHIIPKNLGGHDHPRNFYIMPTSVNQSFGGDFTKEKRKYVGERVYKLATFWAQKWNKDAQSVINYGGCS